MSAIVSLSIAPMTDDDIEAVVSLWQRCDLTRPWNDPRGDIAYARKGPNSAILAGRSDGTLVATAMVGHDGHRGWVYYVAVDPARQGKGLGREIMAAVEAWLRERRIIKLMLMVRPENGRVRAFYESLGYFDQPRALYAKWLDGRAPTP